MSSEIEPCLYCGGAMYWYEPGELMCTACGYSSPGTTEREATRLHNDMVRQVRALFNVINNDIMAEQAANGGPVEVWWSRAAKAALAPFDPKRTGGK